VGTPAEFDDMSATLRDATLVAPSLCALCDCLFFLDGPIRTGNICGKV
jgi:hypothetical protein